MDLGYGLSFHGHQGRRSKTPVTMPAIAHATSTLLIVPGLIGTFTYITLCLSRKCSDGGGYSIRPLPKLPAAEFRFWSWRETVRLQPPPSGERRCEIIQLVEATVAIILRVIFILSVFVAPVLAQAPGTEQQQPEFIKQGQQLMRDGRLDEALALYRRTLQTSPNSLPANSAAGSVLDLMGQGEEARQYLAKAIQVADTPERKAMAQRAMAMSYAFEGNCKKALQYEQLVFNYYGSVKNFFQQGEAADEAARVCIDSGDLDTAYHWYEVGHETGLKEPDIKPARQDLWEFRWEHAQARIAARRGNQAEALKHVAAAKAILDKGTNPEQAQFLPYLQGYVAFYAGDYKAALEELLKANQNDAFIQCMIAETYEKLGDKEKALEYYRKASTAIAHNPAVAYAVPLAKKKLTSLAS
jgi:tetratricopeptide (TPR) repeat protein